MAKSVCSLVVLLFLFCICCRATTVTVTVGSGGNFFSPTSFTIDPGDTVRWVWVNGFHNTSSVTRPSGAPTWYSNITGTDTAFFYVPSVSGLYTYTCTHHSGMDGQFFVTGCTYPSKPVVSTNGATIACGGDTILLSTIAQPGVTYQWINGVTTVSGANTNTLTAVTSGAYKVLVNRCGVDSISDPFPITIQSPSPAFSYIHTGLDYTFTNNTAPLAGTDFIWSFSDGSPDQTTVNAFRTFAAADTYIVTLKATNITTLCSDTFSLNISVTTDTTNPVDTTDTATTSIAPEVLLPGNKSCYVYPNPVSERLNVVAAKGTIISFRNINGSLIKEAKLEHDGAYTFGTGEIPDGLYFLYLRAAAGIVVRKIVVQH